MSLSSTGNHTDTTISLLEDAAPSPLVVSNVASEDSHILATLDGPCMSYTVPTRNTRLYTEELCDSIVKSDYFTELERTNNFFGEPSHPMAVENRLDIYYPYVSHRIRNVRKVPSEGCYYCTVDILDTPYGKILKTLVDVGAQLGISSRGSGRTITKNGQPIIDSKSYVFITYDLVHMPGLKSARMTKINSDKASRALESTNESVVTKLANQINKYIDDNNLMMLESIKPIFNYLDLSDPEVTSLQEKIDYTLNPHEIQTPNATVDLLDAYKKVGDLKEEVSSKEKEILNLKDQLLTTNKDATNKDATNDELLKVNKDLDDSLNIIEVQKTKINDLIKSNKELLNNIDTISSSMNSVLTKYKELKSSISTQSRDTDREYDNKLVNITKELHDKDNTIAYLNNLLGSYKTSSKSKDLDLKSNSNKIAKLEKRLASCDNSSVLLQSKVSELTNKIKSISEKYLGCRCSQLGLNESLIRNTILDRINTGDIDSIEESIGMAYRSFKSSSKLCNPSSLTNSLGSKKVQGSINENFATSQDETLSNKKAKILGNSELDALSSICRAVRDGQVKQF